MSHSRLIQRHVDVPCRRRPSTPLDRSAAQRQPAARPDDPRRATPGPGGPSALAELGRTGPASRPSVSAASTQPWAHQAAAAELALAGAIGGRRHRHRVRQVARPTCCRAQRLLRRHRGPTAAARPRSTSPRPRRWPPTSSARIRLALARELRAATYDGDTPPEERDWVRQSRRPRADQPGHAAPRHPAGPRPLGVVPQAAAVRRRRRVPRLPRRVRLARRAGAAPAAAARAALRRRPGVRPRLGHGRRPGHDGASG